MSGQDRQRLLDNGDEPSECENYGNEPPVSVEGSVQAVPSNDGHVRFSARPDSVPRFAPMNRLPYRYAAPRRSRHAVAMPADMVYGDGNIFKVHDQADKRKRCGNWRWMHVLLTFAMLALIVLLMLAVTGVLPIGISTYHDVVVPPATTATQMQQQQRTTQRIKLQPATVRVDPKPQANGPALPRPSADQVHAGVQLVNGVIDQAGKVLNDAGLPNDAKGAANTALNGAKQLLNVAANGASRGASAGELARNMETQLAAQAMLNAAQNAVGGRPNDNAIDLGGALAKLTGSGYADPAKLVLRRHSGAGRPGVVGPLGASAGGKTNGLQADPVPANPPVTDDDVKKILENTFRLGQALAPPTN